MPGIHPTSRRQIRYAFAAESRGEMPKGTGARWAHDWKCWTKKPVPKGCRAAMKILSDARAAGYPVPREILAARRKPR
jgi:hypothetical protein